MGFTSTHLHDLCFSPKCPRTRFAGLHLFSWLTVDRQPCHWSRPAISFEMSTSGNSIRPKFPQKLVMQNSTQFFSICIYFGNFNNCRQPYLNFLHTFYETFFSYEKSAISTPKCLAHLQVFAGLSWSYFRT